MCPAPPPLTLKWRSVVEIFGLLFFILFANVSAVVGAAYYHFAWGVGKMKRELAEANERIAAMEAAGKDAAQKLKRAE